MVSVSVESHPEIAFMGRSNVGKSSIINMISNRKKLAFTSNTPGKTSEYNYFEASGEVGRRREKKRFYLVDMPGVGYAEVERVKKESWIELLARYTSERRTLRAVFHLIDSRHGALDADYQCFSVLRTLPEHVNYIVVLTKFDKLATSDMRKTSGIVNKIRDEVTKYTDKQVSIIYTSSESRKGGCALWSAILNSVSEDSVHDFSSTFRTADGDA